MTQVQFNENMLTKFEEGRSNSTKVWKGFRLKRNENESESNARMAEIENFGIGQVQ